MKTYVEGEESDGITVVYFSSCSFICQYFKHFHIYRPTNDKKERVDDGYKGEGKQRCTSCLILHNGAAPDGSLIKCC